MSSENDPQTFAIIGAAMEVHSELRSGLLESVYGDALAVEFASRRIPFEREVACPVQYKGGILPTRFAADFVCFGEVIVELKAVKLLGEIENAQVINYLKITRFKRALLLNFGARSLQHKRFVLESGLGETPDLHDQ